MTTPFDDRWDKPPPPAPEYIHITNGSAIYDDEPSDAAEQPPAATRTLPDPVDWHALLNREHRTEDWAIPSVLPAGRSGTVWAKRKTGKSLLVVDLVAAVASGLPVLGQQPTRPRSVIYCDLEMTEDDLEERVIDGLGYHPDQLDNLHYYLLPTLPPLDDYAGGAALMELVQRHQAELVVIDTLSRVVTGDENSADTIRAYYRCTGIRLKQAGVSSLRLDHGGKENDRGERGSSAKGDDVDLAWELRAVGGDEYVLKRSYSRISWVPEQLKLRREVEPLRHVLVDNAWPAGTRTCADHLDQLEVGVQDSVRTAVQALKTADISPRRTEIVAAAQRWRRSPDKLLTPPKCFPETLANHDAETLAGNIGKRTAKPLLTAPGNSPGNTGKQGSRASGKQRGFLVGKPPGSRPTSATHPSSDDEAPDFDADLLGEAP